MEEYLGRYLETEEEVHHCDEDPQNDSIENLELILKIEHIKLHGFGITIRPDMTLKRKIGPEGTSWCSNCKEFYPIGHFQRNRSTWSGLQRWCTPCKSEHKRMISK